MSISTSMIIHVCTSCRLKKSPREQHKDTDGYKLYKSIQHLLSENSLRSKVKIQSTECLSLCPRPCAVAFSSSGSWSYLFGDQDPEKTANDIIECLSLYLNTEEGLMLRSNRPASLRSSILGRIPPEISDSTV